MARHGRNNLYFGNWRWGGGVQWVAGQRGWEGRVLHGVAELVIQIHIQIRGKRKQDGEMMRGFINRGVGEYNQFSGWRLVRE
jgi:hypothetical protein